MQKITFVTKHKADKRNQVVDALNRRANLLALVQSWTTSMKNLQGQYEYDEDFSEPWRSCLLNIPYVDFNIRQGYLFKGSQLCI